MKQELATIMEAAGRLTDAEAIYTELAAAFPANPGYREQAAELYARAGKPREALARYQRLPAASTDEERKAGYAARIAALSQQAGLAAPAAADETAAATSPAPGEKTRGPR